MDMSDRSSSLTAPIGAPNTNRGPTTPMRTIEMATENNTTENEVVGELNQLLSHAESEDRRQSIHRAYVLGTRSGVSTVTSEQVQDLLGEIGATADCLGRLILELGDKQSQILLSAKISVMRQSLDVIGYCADLGVNKLIGRGLEVSGNLAEEWLLPPVYHQRRA
ncbi:MAG: hypothetical protein V3T17_02415 [Pseudomonadales bacterium]